MTVEDLAVASAPAPIAVAAIPLVPPPTAIAPLPTAMSDGWTALPLWPIATESSACAVAPLPHATELAPVAVPAEQTACASAPVGSKIADPSHAMAQATKAMRKECNPMNCINASVSGRGRNNPAASSDQPG